MGVPEDPSNRREFVRVRSRLTTVFKVASTGKIHRALTRDISGGGVCFSTEELLEGGEVLEVEVRLPDRSQPVLFSGVVSWSRLVRRPQHSYEAATFNVGVQFVSINPKDRNLLVAYAQMNALPPGSEEE